MAETSILILAAGKGVRMKSALPKVLHPVGGVPMIERVVRTAASLKPRSICVILGHGSEQIREYLEAKFPNLKIEFGLQRELNGTGGAVRQVLPWLKKQKGALVVMCGDAPLIKTATLKELMKDHVTNERGVTVLSAGVPDPKGYGRIRRATNGDVLGIVEDLDASQSQKQNNEINTGTYCFNAVLLTDALPRLQNNNTKREYYLTDTLALIRQKARVGAYQCSDAFEALGVNSRLDLAKAEKALNQRKLEGLMGEGVTFVSPETCYVGDEVSVGPDTVIWPQTFLLGKTKIGAGCQIGPWTHIKNTIVEDGAVVQASFCDDSIIRKNAKVGPYSRVRPHSDVGENAHLGNFSEIKNTRLGEGAKVKHLSYLGDAKIGKCVNIGAGSITCNYDGFQKHPTEVQDHAFIGSNTNLIAPVRVGSHAVVGAGSSISENVPDWALAVERAPLKIKDNWAKQKLAKASKLKKGKKK